MRYAKSYTLLLSLLFLLLLQGCWGLGGLGRDGLVKHPDAPMLIMKVKGKKLLLSIYDRENNKLIQYGWVKLDNSLEGWTIIKYDWEKFILKKERTK